MNIAHLTEELDNLRDTIRKTEDILPASEDTGLWDRVQRLVDERQSASEEIQTLKQSASQENEQHLNTIGALRNELQQQKPQYTGQDGYN